MITEMNIALHFVYVTIIYAMYGLRHSFNAITVGYRLPETIKFLVFKECRRQRRNPTLLTHRCWTFIFLQSGTNNYVFIVKICQRSPSYFAFQRSTSQRDAPKFG